MPWAEGEFESESFSYEFGGFRDSEFEFPLSEAEEVELAMELLRSVSSEAEMDQFLGKMFKKVCGASRRSARSSARSPARWAVHSRQWRRRRCPSSAARSAR